MVFNNKSFTLSIVIINEQDSITIKYEKIRYELQQIYIVIILNRNERLQDTIVPYLFYIASRSCMDFDRENCRMDMHLSAIISNS